MFCFTPWCLRGREGSTSEKFRPKERGGSALGPPFDGQTLSSASSSPWSSYYSSAGKHVSIPFFSQHHQLSASSSASWSPWSRITHRPESMSAYPSLVSIISCQHHHRHHGRRGLVLFIGRQACQHILL